MRWFPKNNSFANIEFIDALWGHYSKRNIATGKSTMIKMVKYHDSIMQSVKYGPFAFVFYIIEIRTELMQPIPHP
ncbi:hypothetical protein CYD30_19210 [Kosakonia cowanii]|nr:hypothetical protein CYD30_19210 [Kosakonia cowanii]